MTKSYLLYTMDWIYTHIDFYTGADLPLFCKFPCSKSSHFNKNPHDWDCAFLNGFKLAMWLQCELCFIHLSYT